MEDKALIKADTIVPGKLFSDKTEIDTLLGNIEKVAMAHVPVLDTDKGRKDIASMAAKVARSKTLLDGLGKDLVTEWKTKSKAVDAHRKIIRDRLDELKVKVRQPLTDYENAEKERIENLRNRLESLEALGIVADETGNVLPVDMLRENLIKAEDSVMTGDTWEEYATAASKAKDLVVATLSAAIERQEKAEAEQAELEKLRKESEERERKDYEDSLRKIAADNATREAEAQAAKQMADLNRREQEALEKAEHAKRDKIAAEEKAKIDKEMAVKAERDAAAAEAKRKEDSRLAKIAEEKAQAEAFAADIFHQKTINNAALASFEANGIDTETAKTVIGLIAKNLIVGIKIEY